MRVSPAGTFVSSTKLRDERGNVPCVLRWGLPMTIRRHSDFEDRQLMLFGTATIVLLVIAWTFAYLASRAV